MVIQHGDSSRCVLRDMPDAGGDIIAADRLLPRLSLAHIPLCHCAIWTASQTHFRRAGLHPPWTQASSGCSPCCGGAFQHQTGKNFTMAQQWRDVCLQHSSLPQAALLCQSSVESYIAVIWNSNDKSRMSQGRFSNSQPMLASTCVSGVDLTCQNWK
ncbi:uncharacterized protein B0I36DRAFT_27592 [Microdochium trichocladiopsis]|uniref:Uncharacterized protein n=1 Tax=Microdochium trichocladiopsis TaxID=1682393 RepID=A0A9P9BNL5_9PEZI|nr:uncharacterized protein B0I36DRAFT_27592 [Microdochium trichocladiopsis]KAH7020983.1 hypothetical protein B0I36DRAFT_27592 [Microdochium trichocladiopsis]